MTYTQIVGTTASPQLDTRTLPLPPNLPVLVAAVQECLGIDAPALDVARSIQSLDWPNVVAAAERQRVLPILHGWLEQHALCGVPESVLAQTRQTLSVRAIHGAMISLKMATIAAALAHSRIRVLFFKGPVLATVAYPEPWMRETRDIDLLVHRDDVEAAKASLIELGYKEVWTSGLEDSMGLWNCINLYDGVAAIDLQWDEKGRSYFSPFDFDHIWQRHTSVTFNDTAVPTLSNEDLLLLLSLHGNKHCWFTLSLVVDLAALVRRRADLDWGYVWAQAEQMEMERTLSLGLYLTQALFGVALPAATQAKVDADPQVPVIARQIYCWLFAQDAPLSPAAVFRFNFSMKSSPRRKINYLLHYVHVLITPNKGDESALALPSSLAFLYYFLRPFRLLKKHLLRK